MALCDHLIMNIEEATELFYPESLESMPVAKVNSGMNLMFTSGILIFVSFFYSCKQEKSCTLPIKINQETKHLLLSVTCNGQTSDFIFDTGCSITVVKENNHINTSGKKEFNLFTFDSDTVVNRYPKGRFNVGSFTISVPFVEDKKDNILGMDIISRYYWFFDLEKETVRVSDSPIVGLEKEAFGLDFFYQNENEKVITVDLQIKPESKFTMLFDTGAGKRNGLFLFQNADSIIQKGWKISESDIFFQPKSKNWVWMSDSLQVSNYMLHYLLFVFDTNQQRIKRFNEIGFDGIIPVDFVYRYKQFYIDFKAKKMFFYKENDAKRDELKGFFDYIKDLFKRLKPIE